MSLNITSPLPTSGSDNGTWQTKNNAVLQEIINKASSDSYTFVANVKNYGAVGDGITDDTVAIQNAINSSDSVLYFPDGIYLCGGIITNNKTRITGNGKGSILKSKGNFKLITVQANDVIIDNLTLLGTSNVINTSEVGIYINDFYNIKMCDLIIDGFKKSGIENTNLLDAFIGNHIINCIIRNCNNGIFMDTRGEYTIVEGCSLYNNSIGIKDIAGNIIINGCVINSNSTGVYVGNGANDSHGTIASSMINHNEVYGLHIENISNGHKICDNQIFANSIYVKTNINDSVVFDNNTFGTFVNIYLEGAIVDFKGNTLLSSMSTYDKNYNSSPSTVNYVGNKCYKTTYKSIFESTYVNTISSGINITPLWNINQMSTLLLTSNATLNAPTAVEAGTTMQLKITQDAIGGRTLAFNSSYKFPNGMDKTLSSSPNSTDILTLTTYDGVIIYCTLLKGFS